MLGLYFKHAFKFIRRDKRSLIFVFVLALYFSSVIVVHVATISVIEYEREFREIYRIADFSVGGNYIDSGIIETVKSTIKNVKYCAGFIRYSTNIISGDTIYHIYVYGIDRSPEVNTVPDIVWDEFVGNKVIVEPTLARALGIREGDVLILFGEEFIVYKVTYSPWLPSLEYSGYGSVIMPIETLRRIMSLGELYNRIGVLVWDRGKMLETMYRINQILLTRNVSNINFNLGFIGTEAVVGSIRSFYDTINMVVVAVVLMSVLAYLYLNVKSSARNLVLFELIGFRRRDLENLFMSQVTIIVLMALAISVIVGVLVGNILIMYSLSTFGFKVLDRFYFSLPLREIALCLISTFVFSLAVIKLFLRSYDPEKAVRENPGSWVGSSEIVSKYGNPIRKLAFRNISTRKLRSIAIILLISSTIAGSVAMHSVVITGEKSLLISFSRDYRWEIDVVLYDINKTREIRNYIDHLGSVNYTEEIIYSVAPIIEIIGKKRITPPYHAINVLGITGNETLIHLNFIEGNVKYGNYIAISSKLANLLMVGVGDQISIVIVHPLGMKVTVTVEISGIFNDAMHGGWVLAFNLLTARRELGLGNNAILVSLKDKEKAFETASKIASFLDDLGVESNIILQSGRRKVVMRLVERLNTFLMPLIIAISIILSIALILIISGEISNSSVILAVLYALGMKRRELTNMMLYEYSILIGLSTPLSIAICHQVTLFLIDTINSSILRIWLYKLVPSTAINLIMALHIVLILIITATIYLKVSMINIEEAVRLE